MKLHPDLPFVRLIRAYEHDPSLSVSQDHVVSQNDWRAFYDDGTTPPPGYFPSEQAAQAGAEQYLFEERPDLVERYIQQARTELNLDMLIRLVEGRARADARKAARVEFAHAAKEASSAMAAANAALQPFQGC